MIQIKTKNNSNNICCSNFEETFINFLNILIEKEKIKSIGYIDIYSDTVIEIKMLEALKNEIASFELQINNNKLFDMEFPVNIGNLNSRNNSYNEILTSEMYRIGMFDLYFIVQCGIVNGSEIVIIGN